MSKTDGGITATINTDASFSQHMKVGGCAYWITTTDKMIFGGFYMEGSDINDCEGEAILKAILKLEEIYRGTKLERLWINSDSKLIINMLNGDFKVNRKYAKCISEIMESSRRLTKTLSPKHVKAHTGYNTKRHHVNRWCDDKAKKMLGSAVNDKQNDWWKRDGDHWCYVNAKDDGGSHAKKG